MGQAGRPERSSECPWHFQRYPLEPQMQARGITDATVTPQNPLAHARGSDCVMNEVVPARRDLSWWR